MTENAKYSSSTEWGLVFALIKGTASHHSAGKVSFAIVSELVATADQDPHFRIENLGGLISILEEFAYVPGRAVAFKSDRRTRTVDATPLYVYPLHVPPELVLVFLMILFHIGPALSGTRIWNVASKLLTCYSH
jgi:hypothetical protein